jgi:5'-AMP-activated protein kinase catalytic alpha subunit
MEEYDFKKEEVRMNLLTNRHNHITTCYYLLLKSKIKKGIPSVSDLISDEFRRYLTNGKNLLTNHNHDINLVVQERSVSPRSKDIMKKNNNEINILKEFNRQQAADLAIDINSNFNFNIGKFKQKKYIKNIIKITYYLNIN